MRVALVGAGRVARVHAAAFAAASARIARVVDPRLDAARELAACAGGAASADLGPALGDPDIDAVVVAVPHDLHAEVTEAALLAGKHVYSDKPLATDMSDGTRLLDLARERSLTLAVCHNLLFHPAVEGAAELVDAGVLGRPTTVDAWNCGWLDLPAWDFRLSARATGGGAWFDGGGHLVYTIEALLTPFRELSVARGAGPSRIGGEDACAASGRLESGAAATLRVSYADRLPGADQGWPTGWQLGFELRGTGGSIRLDLLPSARIAWHDGEREHTEVVDASFEASFHRAAADFVQAVAAGRPPRVDADDALRTLALLRGAEPGGRIASSACTRPRRGR